LVNHLFTYSEELAQRLQEEENRVAQQVQEEQNGRSRINNQPPSSAVENSMPSTSSSSRQVERHESQRTKNVSGNVKNQGRPT
jgi:hypothetical protein